MSSAARAPPADTARTFDALTGKAQVLKLLGRWDEAQEIFAQTVSMAEQAGDRPRLLTATINIGDILRFRGQYDRAMEWRTRGLELAREIGDKSTMATVLGNMGGLHLELRNDSPRRVARRSGCRSGRRFVGTRGSSQSEG